MAPPSFSQRRYGGVNEVNQRKAGCTWRGKKCN
nr:MAG TPA: hypothetical protein [Caudoviricetes sp.]